MERSTKNVGPAGRAIQLLGTGAGLGIFLGAAELAAFSHRSESHHTLVDVAWPGTLTALAVMLVFVCATVVGQLLWRPWTGRWSVAPIGALTVFGACIFFGLAASDRLADTLASLRADRPFVLSTIIQAAICAAGAGIACARAASPSASVFRWARVVPATSLAAAIAYSVNGLGLSVVGVLLFGAGAALFLPALRKAQPTFHIGLLGLLVLSSWLARPDETAHLARRTPWQQGPVRNVVLISIDTLRPTSLSCYAPNARTPAIDQIADDGILFERALSPAPWTLPALSSIMTGLPPSVHGAQTRQSLLPSSLPTLAELLTAQGYVTGAIGANHLLGRGLSRGFQSVQFFPVDNAWESLGFRWFDRSRPATTETLTNLSIDWIEANASEPFFLWLHYLDPHSPYAPPAEYQPPGTPPPRIGRGVGPEKFKALRGNMAPTLEERAWVEALYDGEVRYVDDQVRRIARKLKELDLYEDALILLTSDHGEEFWEHESLGHGHTLFDEVLRVPLIVKLPGASVKGRVQATVTTQRILPTVLELCGVDTELSDRLLKSLVPETNPNGSPLQLEANAVVSSGMLYGEDKFALTDDRSKLIRGVASNKEWFFDLQKDPGERYAIPPMLFAHAATMRAALEEHAARARALRETIGAATANVQAVDVEALKALGYL